MGKAQFDGTAEFIGHLRGRRHAHTAIVRLAGVRFLEGGEHPGRARPQAAVGEDLDVAQPQVIVAEAVTQSQCLSITEVMRGDVGS